MVFSVVVIFASLALAACRHSVDSTPQNEAGVDDASGDRGPSPDSATKQDLRLIDAVGPKTDAVQADSPPPTDGVLAADLRPQPDLPVSSDGGALQPIFLAPGTTFAYCPSKTYVVGGGVQCSSSVLRSSPIDKSGKGWQGNCSKGVKANVWAICLGGATGATLAYGLSSTASSGSENQLCGANQIVGGGCNCNSTALINHFIDDTKGAQCGCGFLGVSAYAICIPGKERVKIRYELLEESNVVTVIASKTCPAGKRLLGGSCSGTGGLIRSAPLTTAGVTWQCVWSGASSTKRRIQIICAKTYAP